MNGSVLRCPVGFLLDTDAREGLKRLWKSLPMELLPTSSLGDEVTWAWDTWNRLFWDWLCGYASSSTSSSTSVTMNAAVWGRSAVIGGCLRAMRRTERRGTVAGETAGNLQVRVSMQCLWVLGVCKGQGIVGLCLPCSCFVTINCAKMPIVKCQCQQFALS